MRLLHEAAASNLGAWLAIEMFCYSVRKQVAAMIAVLGGLDMLVCTGRIGESDAQVRIEICAGLAWIMGAEAAATILEVDVETGPAIDKACSSSSWRTSPN